MSELEDIDSFIKNSPHAQEAINTAKAQFLAVSLANLAAVPVLAKFCGEMLVALMQNGFTREEALYIVKASAGAK
jgi:hypothetical protein